MIHVLITAQRHPVRQHLMSEKTDIEWATGETFISLYNAERATTYLAQPFRGTRLPLR